VAVNRNFGEKKEVDYIPVVTWRGLADNCGKFLAKGRKVGVSGRIQTRSYDAQDGTKRYVTEIVADDVEFLTPKGDAGHAADVPPPPDDSGLFGDESDFEPLDEESMPF
jgi:single-strand DNA-binding protein